MQIHRKENILVKINAHVPLVLISKELPLQVLIARGNVICSDVILPFVPGSTGSPIARFSAFANIFLVLESSIELFTPFALDAFNIFRIGRWRGGWLLIERFASGGEDRLTVITDDKGGIH